MILIVKSTLDMSRFALFFTAAALLPALAGCGQAGPLYLPAKPVPVTPANKATAPATPSAAPAASVPASK
jgi:predicted small lipoprotein YifL